MDDAGDDGLDNGKFAVKDGGVIILVASCKEGLENKSFERWMTTMTPDEMVVEIKKNFELGGHKAAAIALVKQKVDIYLVSDLDPDFVRPVLRCRKPWMRLFLSVVKRLRLPLCLMPVLHFRNATK